MSWHRREKKLCVTLAVDGYAPSITELTFPLMKHWCFKHGYEFVVISERKHPEWPPVMEKFQCYDIIQAAQAEKLIFYDADALIHPDFFDPFEHIPLDHCFHNGHDMCNLRWDISKDRFFKRDGRMLAGGNWLTGATCLTYDIWAPHDDITIEQAIKNIHPVVSELKTVIEPSHLVDDYLTSRNIAKYGLKFAEIRHLCEKLGVPAYLWHNYVVGIEEKVLQMQNALADWGLRERPKQPTPTENAK
jgi:hypothetical protein